MKTIISIFSFVLLFTQPAWSDVKPSDFSTYGDVKAVRTGLFNKRITKILLKSKGEWKINSQYPIIINLDDRTLYKSDGKYHDLHDNKATEVLFETKSTSMFGTAKLVFCNANSCSAPITARFNIEDN
jgi:hypothetical protein